MPFRLSLTLCFLFFVVFGDCGTSSIRADELHPHRVVVRSSYREEARVPDIDSHHFDIRAPGQIEDPYRPDFTFNIRHLPQAFPQNQTFHWLTSLAPGLSRLFRGNEGRLENGIRFYQQDKHIEAELELMPLVSENTEQREKATLYLAWIKYQEGLRDETLRLTERLRMSAKTDISREAQYLRTLVYLQRKDYRSAVDDMNSGRSRSPGEALPLKQAYAYLICLFQLEHWHDAKALSHELLHRPIRHAKSFYKIIELAALIDYAQGRYDDSLAKFIRARAMNRLPSYQYRMNRRIAWLQYMTKDYKGAVRTVNQKISAYRADYQDELTYLLIACRVRQNNWAAIGALLDRIDPSSVFYTYSAFLIRSNLQTPAAHPQLFESVSRLQFDFPEMKFHVAMLNGNLAFENGSVQAAKTAYLRALSVDSRNPDYWKAHYNLGLTQLKLKQLSAAVADFKQLLKTGPEELSQALQYHLAYATYLLADTDATLQALKQIEFSRFNDNQQNELRLIRAGSLLRKNRPDQALIDFQNVWSSSRQPLALEFMARIHYDQQRFEAVLELLKRYPEHRTDTLVIYEIKSLLALRRFKEAQAVMRGIRSEEDEFIELRLKVWFANQKYESIIQYVSQLLQKPLSREKRRSYHLHLGDAYFNRQQYRKSKNQFFRALNLTEEPELKSLILYNIALSSYYYKDYTAFLREADQVITKPHISAEIRYNLTLLLAEYYQSTEDIKQADTVYRNYVDSFAYNQASIHIKRIRLWYQQKQYQKCASLSRQPMPSETDFQRRDRIVMFGYCGNQQKTTKAVIQAIVEETEQHAIDYRNNELNYLLAKAYAQSGSFQRSLSLSKQLVDKPLNPAVRIDNRLLIIDNLVQLQQSSEAMDVLGDINQYRDTGHYVKTLELRSEIEFQQQRFHKAHRTLLRIFYLPESSETEKQTALLRLTEGYLNEGDLNAAAEHLKKIDRGVIMQEPENKKRYQTIAARIKALAPES